MLRDVKHNVTDGQLRGAASTGDGIHVKVGVSPIVSDTPILITGDMDAARIRSRLGLSPLADAAMDAVQWGAASVYCLPVSAAAAGKVGEVSKSGSGAGSVTIQGTPTNAFDVIVKITGKGGLNSAAFTVSLDGGYRYTDEITVPLNGSYDIEGTGLTIQFAEATDEDLKAESFVVDDTYTLKTTAPTATNGEILAACEKLKKFNQEFEFVHIVGECGLALWLAMSEFQRELMTVNHKPAFVLLEAQRPDMSAGNDLYDWAHQMEADRNKIQNTDIQVCAAWGRLTRLDGTVHTVNLAGLATGRYAMAAVQKSIGQTRPEAGFGFSKDKLLELIPTTLDDTIIEVLDKAGYLTFRGYDGLDDFFVYHTKMMCPKNSDFMYAEDVRVKNKMIRETRKEALLLLNDDIDMEDIPGELAARAKFTGAALDRMVDAGEISNYEITVVDTDPETFVTDGTMRVRVRYVSRGYIREIVIDLGRVAQIAG